MRLVRFGRGCCGGLRNVDVRRFYRLEERSLQFDGLRCLLNHAGQPRHSCTHTTLEALSPKGLQQLPGEWLITWLLALLQRRWARTILPGRTIRAVRTGGRLRRANFLLLGHGRQLTDLLHGRLTPPGHVGAPPQPLLQSSEQLSSFPPVRATARTTVDLNVLPSASSTFSFFSLASCFSCE